MAIFDKQWWIDTLLLNEVLDNEVEDKIIKGFNLYPYKQGFGRAFKTLQEKASSDLAKRINEWIRKHFPGSQVKVIYEGIYSTINIINPNVIHESIIHESPPINFEDDTYQNYITQNRSKIEKAAGIFNIPIDDMEYAFNAGGEVVLSDDMWKKMQNTKSYNIKILDDAIAHSLKLVINPKIYIDRIKSNKDIPLPLVLCYGPDKYYLVGGEVILSLYRALGSIPTVLQGTLNLQTKTLPEPLNENIKDNRKQIIKEFIEFAIKELNLQKLPTSLTLSRDNNAAKSMHSFGSFDPNDDKIWLYVKNRNMADILRTLAHELVHQKQAEDGRIDYNSGETGSEIENEANAIAGILLRDFGKQNNNIYEGKYGDYLFGGKESGAAIKWYDQEVEKDTPAEKVLFDFMRKYADSEISTYSNIDLDSYAGLFKTLKKQYPEIADPNISPDTYLYRGTSFSRKQIDSLNIKEDEIEIYPQGYIIPNQEYKSRRKVQSWSTSYFVASGFAFSNQEQRGGHPVIMRAKAKDMELFFKPEFMNKLSTQIEDETFNITSPIPVDIMVIQEKYRDEFEDIEAGYLHDK